MKFNTYVVVWVLGAAANCGLAAGQEQQQQELTNPTGTTTKTTTETSANIDPWAPLSESLADVAETGFGVGMGVAILSQDGSVSYKHGFGEANQATGLPYSTSTVQPIASVSKTLLGVALAKAQELGILTLDDAVNDYLSFDVINPHFRDTPITLRHLATHTSSMSDTDYYSRAYIFDGRITRAVWRDLPPGEGRQEIRQTIRQYNRNRDISLEKFLQRIYVPCGQWYSSASFTQQAPGDGYEYSNAGAGLASLVLEGAIRQDPNSPDMTYRDFVQTYILDPLEMKDSGWDMADYAPDERAVLYPFGNTAIPNFTLITEADGGFVTNIDDFVKYWGAAMRGLLLQQDNILKATTWETLLTEGIFWVPQFVTPTSYGHDGGDPGITTIALFDTVWKQGYIIFANSMDDEVMSQALELMVAFTN